MSNSPSLHLAISSRPGRRIPSRISKMPRRRQKIVFKRHLRRILALELAHFIGVPLSSEVEVQMCDAVFGTLDSFIQKWSVQHLRFVAIKDEGDQQ